jgi:hypothetical protein
MTKFLEKPILRTLPTFYAQATATPARRMSFGWMSLLAVIGSFTVAGEAPTLALRIVAFAVNLAACIIFLALVILIWNWLDRRSGPSTRN